MIPPYLSGMLLGVIIVLYIINYIESRKTTKKFNQLMDDWDKSIKDSRKLEIELKESLKKVNIILDSKNI